MSRLSLFAARTSGAIAMAFVLAPIAAGAQTASVAAQAVRAAGASSSIPVAAKAIGAARAAAAGARSRVDRMAADADAADRDGEIRGASQGAPQSTATVRPRVPATVRRDTGSAGRDNASPGVITHARGAPTAVPRPSMAHAGETETFRRETFAYDRRGRRDPFISLMNTSELRPLISDLKLTVVVFDATGANSVAVLRDLNTKEQYRVKVGQVLGRMRVSRIEPKTVVFTVEEFGFSRQETISLSDPSQARKK